jgi:outer membrane protein assembly factor BamA
MSINYKFKTLSINNIIIITFNNNEGIKKIIKKLKIKGIWNLKKENDNI